MRKIFFVSNGNHVPRTQRSVEHLRNGALQSLKRVYARLRRAMAPVTCDSKKPGSRFCEAALRKGYALHRARDTDYTSSTAVTGT